jgi:hypothetical protein
MENFTDLLSQSTQKYGNANIIFALLFLKNNFTLFGGCLRDHVAKLPSKDIDLLISFDKFPLFSFENDNFNDKFIEYIKSILLEYNITVLDVERKIDVLEKEGRYTETTEENEELLELPDDYLELVDDAELLHAIENPTADPDHIKYQLKLLIENIEYVVTIDISFVTQELLTNIPFKPTVIQDSCFIDTSTTDLLKSTNLTLEMVEDFIDTNLKSFIPAVDIGELKKSLVLKNIEPYELDKKRALKLARLLEEGWTLELFDQQLGTFDQDTLINKLREIQKKHFDANYEEQQQLQKLQQFFT